MPSGLGRVLIGVVSLLLTLAITALGAVEGKRASGVATPAPSTTAASVTTTATAPPPTPMTTVAPVTTAPSRSTKLSPLPAAPTGE